MMITQSAHCRMKPSEPLVLLCIAAGLINQACARGVSDKEALVLQAFAFLEEYAATRLNTQVAVCQWESPRIIVHLSVLHANLRLFCHESSMLGLQRFKPPTNCSPCCLQSGEPVQLGACGPAVGHPTCGCHILLPCSGRGGARDGKG